MVIFSSQMHNLSSVMQGSVPWSFWLTHTAQFKSLQSALAQTDPVKHDTGHCSKQSRMNEDSSSSLSAAMLWWIAFELGNECFVDVKREREAVFPYS